MFNQSIVGSLARLWNTQPTKLLTSKTAPTVKQLSDLHKKL